jgi:hypothetical protein
MKPLPAPEVPGRNERERMDNALRLILSVSKDDLLKKEMREKRLREQKKRAKKT